MSNRLKERKKIPHATLKVSFNTPEALLDFKPKRMKQKKRRPQKKSEG